MSDHVITQGKNAVKDIGFLIGRELNRLEREINKATILSEMAVGKAGYFSHRVKELKHQKDKMSAYNMIFMGASSIAITHHVESEAQSAS